MECGGRAGGGAVGRVGRNWNFDRIGRSPVEAGQGEKGGRPSTCGQCGREFEFPQLPDRFIKYPYLHVSGG